MNAPASNAVLADWLDYVDTQPWQTVEMGLGRIRQVVDKLGLHRPAPYVITVAGTNGKGTTCLGCEALLLSHGLSVGTTLSPHIDRFNERMRLNGEEVDDVRLCEAFARIEAARGDLPLTYFEFTTAVALWLFQQAQVDVAILEIGLGGRLDSFNVVDADCAVITSIGLDHQAFLGDDEESIGREKAGILRAGQRVVLGEAVSASVLDACRELNLKPHRAGVDFKAEYTSEALWQIETGLFEEAAVSRDLPVTNLPIHNLALSMVAVSGRVTLQGDAVRGALASLSMRGRLESRNVQGRRLLLDVAHNPDGIRFLLKELAARGLVPDAVYLGMLEDKDHAGVFELLDGLNVPMYLIDTIGYRGFPAADLKHSISSTMANAGKDTGRAERATVVAQGQCLETHLCSATTPGNVILALGSFSVVEQMRIGALWHGHE